MLSMQKITLQPLMYTIQLVAAGQKQVIPRVRAGMLSNLGYSGPIKVPVMDGDETFGHAHYRASC